MTSSEWAAWVQAIGSVGAILVAVWVSARQIKAQSVAMLAARERRRQDLHGAFEAIVDHCLSEFQVAVSAHNLGAEAWSKYLNGTYSGDGFQAIQLSFEAFPMHELAGYRAVRAALNIRDVSSRAATTLATAFDQRWLDPRQSLLASEEVAIMFAFMRDERGRLEKSRGQ